MGNNYEKFSRNPQAREVNGHTVLPKYRNETNERKLNKKKTSLYLFFASLVIAGGYFLTKGEKSHDYQENPRTVLVENDFTSIIDHNQVANIKNTCEYKVGEELVVRNQSAALREGTNRQETVFFVDGVDCDSWSFREELMKNTNFSN